MQDPLQKPLAKLATMYDSSDYSNDEILDMAIDLIRSAHSLMNSFISASRFVEAYRQLLHCEEILQETATDRKIITGLAEGSADRKVMDQLRARTMILHGQFEKARSGSVAWSSAPHTDKVGPPPAPRHGGGGFVRTPPIIAPTKPQRNVNSASARRVRSQSIPHPNQSDDDSLPPVLEPPRTPVDQRLMTVAMSSGMTTSTPATLPRVSVRDRSPSPAATEEDASDWRKRGENHVKRAADVVKAAKQSAAEMEERAETLRIRRAEKLAKHLENISTRPDLGPTDASSSSTAQLAAAHRKSTKPAVVEGPFSDGDNRNDPQEGETTAEKDDKADKRIASALAEAKRRCSMERTANVDDERLRRRSMLFEDAEKALNRRLEEAARRASVQNSVFQRLTDIVNDAMATRRMSTTAKRLSIMQSDATSPKRNADRPLYRLSVPNHKLYNEYLRQTHRLTAEEEAAQSGGEDEQHHHDNNKEGIPSAGVSPTLSTQKTDAAPASPSAVFDPNATTTISSLNATGAMLQDADSQWAETFHNLNPEEQQALMVEEAADFLSDVLHRNQGADSSFHDAQDMSPAAVALKMDQRIKRMRTMEAKNVVCKELHEQIEARASVQIAMGRPVEDVSPPPRMSRAELERYLSPETIQALHVEMTNHGQDEIFCDFLLGSATSMSALNRQPQPEVWSSLPALQQVADWTKLSVMELATSFEVSIATLKIQRFVRCSLARGEFHRRQRAVHNNVVVHQRWAEAGMTIARSLKQYVAQRRVESMKSRVQHLNEQRVDLEMSRTPVAPLSQLNTPHDGELVAITRSATEGMFLTDPSKGGFAAWRSRSPTRGMEGSKRRSVAPTHRSRSATTTMDYSIDCVAFLNPFPPFHSHHDELKVIQKRIAARTISTAIREYIAQRMEDLQDIAQEALVHILTGRHPNTHAAVEYGDTLDFTSAASSSSYHDDSSTPFASSSKMTSMLAKYSGNVMERMDRRRAGYVEEGEEDEEPSQYVELKLVRISELEAAKAKAIADAQAKKKAEWERLRRIQELERMAQQMRQQSVALLQRCGRGLRKRLFLFEVLDQLQRQEAAAHPNELLAIRAERFSLSLSNSLGTPTKVADREDQPVPVATDREIIRLISLRNPDLLPERAKALEQDRLERVVQLQAMLRTLASRYVAQSRMLHHHAVILQRAWRRVWKLMQQSKREEQAYRFRFSSGLTSEFTHRDWM